MVQLYEAQCQYGIQSEEAKPIIEALKILRSNMSPEEINETHKTRSIEHIRRLAEEE
jgi:hypothetical protein